MHTNQRSFMAMPAAIAREKIDAMRVYGAEVSLCPSVPFTDHRHYFHVARKQAEELGAGSCFTNQFDNTSNYRAHLEGTGKLGSGVRVRVRIRAKVRAKVRVKVSLRVSIGVRVSYNALEDA